MTQTTELRYRVTVLNTDTRTMEAQAEFLSFPKAVSFFETFVRSSKPCIETALWDKEKDECIRLSEGNRR